jgi:hypothetical protein
MVKVTGPLVRYAPGFMTKLEGDGYRRASLCHHVELLVHLSRWLEAQGLDAIDITSQRVDEFLRT